MGGDLTSIINRRVDIFWRLSIALCILFSEMLERETLSLLFLILRNKKQYSEVQFQLGTLIIKYKQEFRSSYTDPNNGWLAPHNYCNHKKLCFQWVFHTWMTLLSLKFTTLYMRLLNQLVLKGLLYHIVINSFTLMFDSYQ